VAEPVPGSRIVCSPTPAGISTAFQATGAAGLAAAPGHRPRGCALALRRRSRLGCFKAQAADETAAQGKGDIVARAATDLGDDWTAHRRPPQERVYAALDLGTNNCRLLIARPAGHGFRVIDAFSRIVRLGEGLEAAGRLSDAAQARTLDALRVCAAKMRRRGVTHARAIATEACRRASNCQQFLDRVHREVGIPLEIITTDEEASLALYGCTPLLDRAIRHALVFDIGGGSTEVACMDVPRVAGRPAGPPALSGWHSIPIGVVTLAERHGGRQITPDCYETMVGKVQAALAPFEAAQGLRRLVERGELQMLGTSGTVTTLAGIHQCLPRYDRSRVDGYYLDFETVREISQRVAGMSYESRMAHPCIGRERADLVVAGCAILEAVCRTWPVGRLRVADRGLREGMLYLLIGAAAWPARAEAGTASRRPSSQCRPWGRLRQA
jgi:exopolyphosphatase/guanosine-5'-triphosphate,3'-diphosphate pyrophosphatase